MEHEAYFAGVMAMRGLCDFPGMREEYARIKDPIDAARRAISTRNNRDKDLEKIAVLTFMLSVSGHISPGKPIFESVKEEDEAVPNRYRIRQGIQYRFMRPGQPRPKHDPKIADEKGYVHAETINRWLTE